MTPSTEAEVLVVGGGPAGATAAARLARLGHDVMILDATPAARAERTQSIPFSTLPLLQYVGVADAVQGSGFARPGTFLIDWAGRRSCRTFSSDSAGFIVDRQPFDQLLLRGARSAGARVLRPARALGYPCRCDETWTVMVRLGIEEQRIRARFIIDATGRGLWLRGRKRATMPALLALSAHWGGADPALPDSAVEAGSSHWYWIGRLADGRLNVTVFLDPPRHRLTKGELQRVYCDLVSKCDLLAGATLGHIVGLVRACSAAVYLDDAPLGDGWLKTGEAALAVDPLSGQGVHAAVTSGVHAAAVVHTILRVPGHRAAAVQFYEDRQRAISTRYAAESSEHYRDQAAVCRTAFWERRAQNSAFSVPRIGTPHFLPASAGEHISLAPSVAFVNTPVLRHDLVAWEPAVSDPRLPQPVAYVSGIPLVPLLRACDGTRTRTQLLAQWTDDLGHDNAAELWHWLSRHGLITS